MAKLGKPTHHEPRRVADCVDIFRVRGAACAERVADRVIVEEPVTIMVDRVGSFTVMCTPSDLEALAVGFVHSEGMIHSAEDIMAIHAKADLPNVIGMEIREPAQFGIARNLVVASSCGMCGVRNLQKMLADVPACPHSLQVPPQLLLDVVEKLRPMQTTFALTGSSHAAALFDRDGTILAFAEDIGRHNALDKAIGKCLLARQATRGCGVVLSGRVSLEMIAKAARAGIELVVAVSGVSSYAITAAQRWNITLCGFVRNGRTNIYTDPTRIRLTHNPRKKKGAFYFFSHRQSRRPNRRGKSRMPLSPPAITGGTHMQGRSLAKSLTDRSRFVVVAELAAGPSFNFAPIEKFLKAAKDASPDRIPQSFDFVGVTAPQSPGGVANLELADVLTRVRAADLLGSLDFIPHVTCKDHNSDAITSSLVTFRGRSVESVLCLTGDKPVRSQGVFEVESVGLLQLIQRMNDASYLKAGPGQWDSVNLLFSLAAVSPFKYSEASQMQQYYKMEKKIAAGARALITQLGYDWRKSLELMRYLQENHIEIPVLGNVYLLTTTNPAPRLMHDGKLPGCYVSDELLATLQREKFEDHVERAAQQVAMYKAIGAAGVDVGGLPDFDTFVKILSRAEQIGADWEKYKDNLCWPGPNRFYLYDDAGQRTTPGKPKKRLAQRCFNLTHRLILDPQHTGFKMGRGLLRAMGAGKGTGFAYRSFATMEKAVKFAAFDCQDCGDCYLPENFGCCTMGGCEKGLSNAPCGDSTVDGKCGNNLDRICVGERIHDAAVAEREGVPRLRGTINKPRNPALRHTSSILNYLFARDHTKKSPLISIGDQINAANPKTGKVMKEILDLGDAAWSRPTGPAGYIRGLIQSQADDGADYIAVNVDALSDEEGQLAVKMMKQYVRVIRQWGRGVPVCIDSRFEDVLAAGLAEWYSPNPSARPPLLSSIRVKTADKLIPLKKQYDFSFVALLGDPLGGSTGVADACEAAQRLFEQAVHHHGFDPGQVFFDPVSVPLVKDEPTLAGGRGRTYSAFETIRRLRTDSSTHRSHCLLRIDTAAGELPGRAIGVCRAYAAQALEHGLDAAFVNPALHYGEEPADPGLLTLVDAFAHMDGSPDRTRVAKELMAKFCAETQKPRKPTAAPALAKS